MNSQSDITPHFTWVEAHTTSTGLMNASTPAEKERIRNTAYGMEIVRAILKRKPITINSWFRNSAVNAKVGGSPKSEHLLGAAVDFVCPSYGTPLKICQTLAQYAEILNYNQLIYEQTWIHISFPPDGEIGKRQILTYRNKQYLVGILP